MVENKLVVVLNSDGSNEITNITVIHKVSYCSKCLRLLNDNRVNDNKGNEFCCEECRSDYWREIRHDMDDILSNFK